jgi:helix-turn-helix protein
MTTAKRRARRIASDEATSWARNLDLGNPYAKSVLKSLGEYVDGDGLCWVGIPSLASDCDLSPDTVRRRLAWLEDIGAISRHAQWIDEYGRRNGEGRGKRTTDLIRLLIEADTDLIEARAAGRSVAETAANSTPISPSSQQGLNSEEGDVSPRPGLGQPSHCGEGLISEPEPESSPLPPSRGASEPEADQEEPEHFGPAWSAWPGHQVMRRDLALAEFRKLAPDKQRLCRAAIPQFLAMQRRLKRDHVPNFHVWVRHGGFEEFPTAALDAAPSASQGGFYDLGSAEGRAIRQLYAFGGASLFDRGGKVSYPLPITARLLAFADLPDRPGWHWIDTPAQLSAWSKFLTASSHKQRRDIVETRTIGTEQRRGFYAPWPWPPRKDGTISASPEAGENE